MSSYSNYLNDKLCCYARSNYSSTGYIGAKGPTGVEGRIGMSGHMGKQGPQGITGISGGTGPTGPQGPTYTEVFILNKISDTKISGGTQIIDTPITLGTGSYSINWSFNLYNSSGPFTPSIYVDFTNNNITYPTNYPTNVFTKSNPCYATFISGNSYSALGNEIVTLNKQDTIYCDINIISNQSNITFDYTFSIQINPISVINL